ncbi:MAG TPA: hypothetical protein VFE54_10535 [Mucilaginibacter sp.]|jgi:hypothetical protein|nr:hypothetical protein [Mucilaginibacter sp.]
MVNGQWEGLLWLRFLPTPNCQLNKGVPPLVEAGSGVSLILRKALATALPAIAKATAGIRYTP